VKKYTIKRYESTDYKNWNAFINKAKNATFLFHRDFMEYHKDRFEDYSLIVVEEDKWVAILPANRIGNTVHSHQGLTYGGLVYDHKVKLANCIEIFQNLLFFLHSNAIEKLQIKTIPSIYHYQPTEELSYALFLANATLTRRDSLTVIDLSLTNTLSTVRNRGVKAGIKNKLEIKEEETLDTFWEEVLVPNLESKFDTKPVHNLEEISRLKRFFPKNIRQFNVYQDENIIAGTTIFESENVAHCQYIATIKSKKELGGLDYLFNHLITEVFKQKRFFDFGNSNVNSGRNLNKGLSYWKESFGAGTIIHDYYEVQTANFSLLENSLIN